MGSFCIYYEKGFFQYEIIPSVFPPHFIYYKLLHPCLADSGQKPCLMSDSYNL